MMKIPFLDLKKVNAELENDIKHAVQSVVDSGWYILGKTGETFENNCKAALLKDSEGYVIGCNSGTDALILSLLATEVGVGDEVITVSHTAIPTVCAIYAVGAKPVFVDVDPDTWVMNINHVPPQITARTKAIISVHMYGNMVDIDSLKQLLARLGRDDISIIEDVAQAQGSRLHGRQAGTLGRLGAFSFYPSKNIGALGDGGAVFCHTVTDNNSLKALRNYGQGDRYHADIPRGINSRLDEMQAAVLDVKLKHLDDWNHRKSELYKLYRKELSAIPITFQKVTSGCEPAWHLCVIALEDQKTRDLLVSHLNANGIQTLIHYPIPNHRQKAFSSSSCERLPITECLATRILSLPFNVTISQEEAAYMMHNVRSFFVS